MRLATLPGSTRDGQLVVVSRDLSRCVKVNGPVNTLFSALESWAVVSPLLARLAASLENGQCENAEAFEEAKALAPLPRAPQWLDGSAFASHGRLMMKAFNLSEDPGADGLPLMYQGMSDQFLSASQDVPFPSEADGIDFEGEYAVVVDEVPMGAPAATAGKYIRLVLQMNDWSLRALGRREMKTGFGFIQGKPACSIAPVALTPDELGGAWSRGRVSLPLEVELNGKVFGRPNGAQMEFSFPELIAHAAHTRRLSVGTIIGSGTVSNDEAEVVGSACIAERRAIEMISGAGPSTPFLAFGDTVRMECRTADDHPLFGAIEQRVVAG
ncbi:MAG: fumarylacetoacetate hydrolase [Caulobacterales bacterium 68-7]|nr:MAG: fumarylacetoacetate hydrolase [Caulobacterales bacterium 68-7]